MKIDSFNIIAFIALISSIIACISKVDIGQSYLLPIWIVILLMGNKK